MGFNAGRSPGIRISAPIGRGGLSARAQGVAGETSSPTTQEREAAQQPFNPTS